MHCIVGVIHLVAPTKYGVLFQLIESEGICSLCHDIMREEETVVPERVIRHR